MNANESPERLLALRVMMMPRDTNPYGTIFGGVLLSYIDQAGAIGARHEVDQLEFPKHDLVTVAMEGVEFHQPVFVGDAVSFWTELKRVGRTSITMHITVECERDGKTVKLTEADATFVAVEKQGRERRPIPLQGAPRNE